MGQYIGSQGPLAEFDDDLFLAQSNPAGLTSNKGLTLGTHFERYLSVSHFICPLPGRNVMGLSIQNDGYSVLPEYYVALARKFSALDKIGALSAGINVKFFDGFDSFLIDPGMALEIPSGSRKLVIGLYTKALMGNLPDPKDVYRNYWDSWYADPKYYPNGINSAGLVNKQLVSDFRYLIFNSLLEFSAGLTLYGEQGIQDGIFKHLYRVKYLGVSANPTPSTSIAYFIDKDLISKFEFSQGWNFGGVINRMEYELFGYRYDNHIDQIGVDVNVSFFGNKTERKPILTYQNYRTRYPSKSDTSAVSDIAGEREILDSTAWVENRSRYDQERIGVFRGTVFPYINTFGYFTTLLIPPGTSNLFVGNYKTGLVILGCWAPVILASLSAPGDNTPVILYMAGTFTLKVWDLIVSRNYVKKQNHILLEKYHLAILPMTGKVQLVAGTSF